METVSFEININIDININISICTDEVAYRTHDGLYILIKDYVERPEFPRNPLLLLLSKLPRPVPYPC